MRKKLQNITNRLYSISVIAIILIIWQLLSTFEVVPKYMLPSPVDVVQAFCSDFELLMTHLKVTLWEAFYGLTFGVLIGVLIAVAMDHFNGFYKAFYPIIVITQTVPTIAIAPLLVLWLGYGILPKVVLIVITTFFPITIGILDGFQSVDSDSIRLLRSMGASKIQIFYHIKLKSAMGQFFASLKISASYSIVGAVISEWLGGVEGLGVYMTRVKKSYSFDKMFAVIFLISLISLLLMLIVKKLRTVCMPWENVN